MNKLGDFRESPLSDGEGDADDIPEGDRLEKPVRFVMNPYYDKVFFVLLDSPVPPRQTKAKTQNRQFKRAMAERLTKLELREGMPFKEPLLVILSVSGPKYYVENVDVDNISKALLDCMKGVVYVDDKQVYQLIAHKYVRDQSGWSVAIKRITGDPKDGLQPPPFFGPHPDDEQG